MTSNDNKDIAFNIHRIIESNGSIRNIFLFLYEHEIFEPEIVTCIGHNNKNLILYALENGSYTCEITTYISTLIEKQKFDHKHKISMNDKLITDLTQTIINCMIELHPVNIMQDIVYPIYDDISITKLLEHIGKMTHSESGQEWLNWQMI